MAAKDEEPAAAHPAQESRSRDAVAETIRVGVNVLDKLMTLVGELVLARNQLLQLANIPLATPICRPYRSG
jgi:two-component system chemotaxis sensor kinase CheA